MSSRKSCMCVHTPFTLAVCTAIIIIYDWAIYLFPTISQVTQVAQVNFFLLTSSFHKKIILGQNHVHIQVGPWIEMRQSQGT